MMLKDMRLADGAARGVDAATPLADLAGKMYTDLEEKGHGGMDFSFVMKRIRGEI